MQIPEKLKNINILVVDDDELIRELSKTILNESGFTHTWEAKDGQQALTKLENEHFDIIICDWNMPNMNGLELLEKVRNVEKFQHIAFLMATVLTDVDSVKKAIMAGVIDYITKPYEPEILCKKLVTTYAKHLKQQSE